MKQNLESLPQSPPSADTPGESGLAAWERAILDDITPDFEITQKAPKLNKIGKFVTEQGLSQADTAKPRQDKPLDPEAVWQTYQGNIIIEPAANEVSVEVETIVAKLETDHVVKQTPRLVDQMQQADRDNQLTYLPGVSASYGTAASKEQYQFQRQEITEVEALQELHSFLHETSQNQNISQRQREIATSMTENLAFIGRKEYLEATGGIASYWKGLLETNPQLQIYAVAGEIAKAYNESEITKSDEYILDNILGHFSDEELQKYAGRLVLREKDVRAQKPQDLRVVLLDDWTISGAQLSNARRKFLRNNPGFQKSIEVQLLVASEQRIKNGLTVPKMDYSGDTTVPLRAYYLARTDNTSETGARISGFHSAVDFDFEDALEFMVEAKARAGEKVSMPAPANIVRPYRLDSRLPNVDRFYNLTKPVES